MRHPANSRLALLVTTLIVLAFVALDGPNRMLGQWAYAVERGRIQADVEELARIEEVSHAFRLVARAARPGVVNIQVAGVARGAETYEDFLRREQELNKQREEFDSRLENHEEVPQSKIRDLYSRLQQLENDRQDMIERLHEAAGSGIVYDDQGHILTNNHVVGGRSEISVRLPDNREYDAVVVGTDPETDLALIKIDAVDLHPLAFGDSDAMEVGDWVLAVGAPFGLSQSVTHGIISARGRTNINTGRRQIVYQDFIQTDASINPGNSGGPLLNLRGQVIGVNTAIATNGDSYNAGIAFTIPSNMAVKIAERLKKEGEVARGWLGVTMGTLDATDREIFGAPDGGVMVDIILADNPAEKAGLKVEDIVAAINGTPVRATSEMLAVIADIFPGEQAKLDIIRAGKPISLTVTMGRRPPERRVGVNLERDLSWREIEGIGIFTETLRPINAARYRYSETDRGVVVTGVPAGDTTFKPNDLIVACDGERLITAAQFADRFAAAKPGERVRLTIKTAQGETHTVSVER